MSEQSRNLEDNILKLAIKLASDAGLILDERFRKPLSVEYKDESGLDPVTNIDKQIQKHLQDSIKSRFPDHGFLGEESNSEDTQNDPVSEFLWVVDPIDGTKNFIAGLPIYACSIAVLHRGFPFLGVIFLPWPNSGGGSILHAKTGSGAFFNDEKIITPEDCHNRDFSGLITLPGSFSNTFDPSKILKSKIGDFRMTGSISYEMAMCALGVSQLMVSSAPSIWDIAAGTCIVIESGGLVMEGISRRKRFRFFEDFKWNALTTFSTSNLPFENLSTFDVRKWRNPLIAGSPKAVKFTASNLGKR